MTGMTGALAAGVLLILTVVATRLHPRRRRNTRH